MDASAFPRSGIGGPLFGRERELAYLDSLIAGLPERGSTLLVRGEPGIGKSALLAEANQRAAASGMQVLRATGVQSEVELPFAGLHQLLLPLLSGLDKLPSRQREALSAAFGMAETSNAPDRFMIGLAVLELLSDAAEHAPFLVLIDDAQWLDPSTADVLGFVARRVEHESICLLLAIRSNEADPFAETGLPQLVLGGLAEDAAGTLLTAQKHNLSREVRGRLLKEAGGNPLALVELPSRLSPDELEGRVPLPVPFPLTARLEQAFAAQALALPDCTRTLLLVASSDDGEGLLDEILRAVRATDSCKPRPDDFAPAVSAGLVYFDGSKVVFRHPLVRSAIHQAASPTERRAAHAALAEVLSDQPDRQAWHRAADLVGPDEGVADALEEAAERARRRGAIGTAIGALERSVGLSKDQRRRGERMLLAAELAFEMGRRERARTLLVEAQRQDLSTGAHQRIYFMRQWFEEELPSGDTDLDGLVEVAEQVGRGGDLTTATNLLLFAAVRGIGASAGAEVRGRITSASTRLGVQRDDPRLVAIRAFAAPEHQGAEVIETLSRMPPDGGGNPEVARLLGFAANAVGAFGLATSFLNTAVDALRAQGRIAVLASALGLRAYAHLGKERWDLASGDVNEFRRLAEETTQPAWAAAATLYESRLMAMRGEVERAEALAGAVEQIALPMGIRMQVTDVQWARGLAALGDGRHEDAFAHLVRAFRPEEPAWHYSQRHFLIGDLAEAARYTGRVEEVREYLLDTEAAIAKMGSPAGRVAVNYARAMLAGPAETQERLERALNNLRSPGPFLRARLQLMLGVWLRRERRVVDSRPPLRAAKEGFDALGAVSWAERARQELRAAGVESPPRARNAFEDLTPQELQIAHLAASGLSNREIGERLFLSHRTVGVHLYRAFPKLGVTSRGQLRSVLDASLR